MSDESQSFSNNAEELPDPSNAHSGPQEQQESNHLSVLDDPILSQIRHDWIHALFGNDWSQRQGKARMDPYQTVSVSIPPRQFHAQTSLGLSIARLPLGLSVRHVHPFSEAFSAGVPTSSILISINGINLLAEPTKQALERIWQYEGRIDNVPSTHVIQQPVHCLFYHRGRILSVLFFTNPPFGIDWGSCGNFPLIKQVSGYAQTLGVPKGSFLAQISTHRDNNATTLLDMKDMDHALAAQTLKELYTQGCAMDLAFVLTPPQARSGHFERLQHAAETKSSTVPPSTTSDSTQQQTALPARPYHKPVRPDVVAQLEGATVRLHSLFHAPTMLSTSIHSKDDSSSDTPLLQVAPLAFQVAAGQPHSFLPSQRLSSQKVYRPCPPISQKLLDLMPEEHSLLYLLEYELHCLRNLREDDSAWSPIAPLHKTDPASTTDLNAPLLRWLESQTPHELVHSVSIHLPQVLSILVRTSNENHPLWSFLGSLATKDVPLSYFMEFLAQTLDLKTLQRELVRARKKRVLDKAKAHAKTQPVAPAQRRHPRQMPIRIEKSRPSHSSVVQKMPSTPATSDSKTANGKGKKPKRRLFGFFRKRKHTSSSVPVTPVTRDVSTPKTVATTATGASSDVLPNGAFPTEQADGTVERTKNNTITPKALPVISPLRLAKFHANGDRYFGNTLLFLKELEAVCSEIEKSLLRSFSQRIAGWALQPWSANRETELAQVTQVMRERLQKCKTLPMLDPICFNPLVSIDVRGCYILPSAHFPLLLTLEEELSDDSNHSSQSSSVDMPLSQRIVYGTEHVYRTRVEIVEVSNSSNPSDTKINYSVQGSVGGAFAESGPSVATSRQSNHHVWDDKNILTFDTRTSWGAPQTLSLHLSEKSDQIVQTDDQGKIEYTRDTGYSFIDLGPLWRRLQEGESSSVTTPFKLNLLSFAHVPSFDDHGDLPLDWTANADSNVIITIKVSVQEILRKRAKKRMLLFKHDDDLRQEMIAIKFIKACDKVLKAGGLDLKLLTFRCVPLDKRRGFLEWVNGSLPLSEICQPFAGSILGSKKDVTKSKDEADVLSSVAKAGLTDYVSFRRFQKKESESKEALPTNPVQDFLRAFAYDESAPYLIRKDVMETYVKSCAGYCVITYVLGVGDRHLDNLLLHQTGHFFHCDYSFILGKDPKKYLPLRITEDMVNGMGGRQSDNYMMFLSLTCAAFLTLRCASNVRYLVSFLRMMDQCSIPDLGSEQEVEEALMGVRERLHLDLTEEQAIQFMEKLIDESCTSRMWMAVDAIHSLGKRF
eukprot:Nitzschia sp. Nitz4//scaffold17_size182527//61404//65308//NITZ4_001846-RA/size182527-snap-gene-0.275-mRNA-1//1//CDS//3329539316//7635//frame0